MPSTRSVDKWVRNAFDDFVDRSLKYHNRTWFYRFAVNGAGQEIIASGAFYDSLDRHSDSDTIVSMEYRPDYEGKIRQHDIVARRDGKTILVVEAKAPFTNHDGIRFHTGKTGTFKKDRLALEAALNGGVIAAYELVVLYECYLVDDDGYVKGSSMTRNEKRIREQYGIKWPTRPDYSHTAGEREVTQALEALGMKQMKGWDRKKLPGPRSDVSVYIDCALFKMAQALGRV